MHRAVIARETWIKIVTAVVLLGSWEFFGQYANPLLVAVPSQVIAATYELALSGELFSATAESLAAFAVGYAVSLLIGMLIGVAMGANRTVEVVLDPYINALYSMPLIALVPLLMLWVGIGFASKVVIIVLFAVFPIIINTLAGVRNVEKNYLDIGVAFGATRWMTFRGIIIPSAVPYIASGMRLAVSRGIIAMVVAEFLTSIAGLGGLIINYTNQFQTAKAFVPVFVLAILGNLLTYAVRKLEEQFATWR
jgi:ABC-type nitrate/sulfonate/bicarbonate transport system permease component